VTNLPRVRLMRIASRPVRLHGVKYTHAIADLRCTNKLSRKPHAVDEAIDVKQAFDSQGSVRHE